jgi:hypothetical protein
MVRKREKEIERKRKCGNRNIERGGEKKQKHRQKERERERERERGKSSIKINTERVGGGSIHTHTDENLCTL